MKTYDSYAESKIANPESEIYENDNGEFGTLQQLLGSVGEFVICNPADYCMTVEQFLAAGHKFVKGDICLTHGGTVVKVRYAGGWNQLSSYDNERYVLRAAALNQAETFDVMAQDIEAAEAGAVGEYSNEKPKRMKAEYVPVEFDQAWQAVKAFEEGEKFYTHFQVQGWVPINNVQQVVPNFEVKKIYRKVETEIDERQEFIDELVRLNKTAKSPKLSDFFGEIYDSGKFKLVD